MVDGSLRITTSLTSSFCFRFNVSVNKNQGKNFSIRHRLNHTLGNNLEVIVGMKFRRNVGVITLLSLR